MKKHLKSKIIIFTKILQQKNGVTTKATPFSILWKPLLT